MHRPLQPVDTEAGNRLSDSVFSRQFHYFRQFFQDLFVVFPPVWLQAVGAILDPLLGICKITSAIFSQRIQRTVAKQTAKTFRVCAGVAGKILACFILEIVIIGHCMHLRIGIFPFLWYNKQE